VNKQLYIEYTWTANQIFHSFSSTVKMFQSWMSDVYALYLNRLFSMLVSSSYSNTRSKSIAKWKILISELVKQIILYCQSFISACRPSAGTSNNQPVRENRKIAKFSKPVLADFDEICVMTHSCSTSGSAIAEGPRETLVSRNPATTKHLTWKPYRVALFAWFYV